MDGFMWYQGTGSAVYIAAIAITVTIVLIVPLLKEFKYKHKTFAGRKAIPYLILANLIIGIVLLEHTVYTLRGLVPDVMMSYLYIDAVISTLGFPVFSWLYYRRFKKHRNVNIALFVINILTLISYISLITAVRLLMMYTDLI